MPAFRTLSVHDGDGAVPGRGLHLHRPGQHARSDGIAGLCGGSELRAEPDADLRRRSSGVHGRSGHDLKRFKKLTNGHHIIMGRKTFESFPKPLPNRIHIVITRQSDYKVPDGVIVVNSLEDALDAAKKDDQPFIIGGGEIYKQSINRADKLEITRVHSTFEDADTFFPVIDNSIWKEVSRTTHDADEKHAHAFSFITYSKK